MSKIVYLDQLCTKQPPADIILKILKKSTSAATRSRRKKQSVRASVTGGKTSVIQENLFILSTPILFLMEIDFTLYFL